MAGSFKAVLTGEMITKAHLLDCNIAASIDSNVRYDSVVKHLQIETLLKIKLLIQSLVAFLKTTALQAISLPVKAHSTEIELNITIDILWINRLCVSFAFIAFAHFPSRCLPFQCHFFVTRARRCISVLTDLIFMGHFPEASGTESTSLQCSKLFRNYWYRHIVWFTILSIRYSDERLDET